MNLWQLWRFVISLEYKTNPLNLGTWPNYLMKTLVRLTALLGLLWLSLSHPGYCQENNDTHKLRIVDAQSSTPLPFATVLINKDPHRGSVTNLNGWVELTLSPSDTCLKISYVGYNSKTLSVSALNREIALMPIDVALDEVVVFPGINPAHRIIKKTVANRRQNNPDEIDEYTCRIYNKSSYEYLFAQADTTWDDLKSYFDSSYVLLMESAIKRYYQAPDKSFEKIEKVRVSGFKDPSIAPLSNDLQPLHFYDPLIELVDIAYLNPVSPGSHRKYVFLLEDTLYNGRDTTFIISFEPRRNTNFQGLKGFLHINTKGYAIENVVAEPAEKKLMTLHIQQNYQHSHNHWFPRELKSEVVWEDLYNQGLGMRVRSESYFSNFTPHIPEDSVKFSEEVLVFDKRATKDAETALQRYRPSGLSIMEQNTYVQMDSLGEAVNLDFWMTLGEKISDKKFPVGKFYIPLDRLYTFNEFEGNRFGAGLYTDDRMLWWLEAGGWGAYGFRDKTWKYGGDLMFFLDEKEEHSFSASYQYNALFPGHEDFAREPTYIEGYFLQEADYATQQSVAFQTWLKYLQLQISFTHDKRQPQYEYAFLLDNQWVNNYETAEFGARLRFAYKEKYIWQLRQKILIESKWPILTVEYKKALPEVYHSDFDYEKLWLQLDYSYHFPRLGKTTIRVEAGKIWGDVPYSFLFAGAGGWNSSVPVFVNNRFNTMRPNQFANTEMVSAYFSHNFGTRLFATDKWKPQVMVTQAFGMGTLSHKHLHAGKALRDMNKGYYESGVVLNDLVRYNLFNFFYVGLGAGFFYNYGHYATDTWHENLKVKFSGSVTF